jgi:SAM-dependent methyltransferase
MNFQTLFALGMKRHLPPLIVRNGRALDLGASGKFVAPGAEALGAPKWVWPRDNIPAEANSVATIHAYHFLEHLRGRDAASFIREVERVLEPGGVFNYSVPYYTSTLAIQNLEHESFWCEDTFKNLFEDQTYAHEVGGTWRLSVHFQVIVGLVQRNLALVGQIVKDAFPRQDPKWFYPTEIL